LLLSSSCPASVPGIHVFAAGQDVDGRDRPGHDATSAHVGGDRLRS